MHQVSSVPRMTHNEQGLLLRWKSKLVKPGLKYNNELNFKNMNKKLNSVPSAGTKDESSTTADNSTSASVEANPMLSEVYSKTLQQVLIDSLVGKRIKLFRKEYEEYEYREYDDKPKFHYENSFFGCNYESVVCEIVDIIIKDTKEYRIKLIMNDNGKMAMISFRLTEILQLV